MALAKRICSQRLKQPVEKRTLSLTMGRSLSSWPFFALRSASSVVTRGRCISPSLLEHLQWPFLARRIQSETVPIARATPRSIFLGAMVGVIGLWLRAYAAGYLHKQEVLTVTGPYAYTRNPLYLGSAILALGAGIATRSWLSGLILIVYFAVFYSIVM